MAVGLYGPCYRCRTMSRSTKANFNERGYTHNPILHIALEHIAYMILKLP